MKSRMKSRLERLRDTAEVCGLRLFEWRPGDGVTRYRFFSGRGSAGSYFSDTGYFTALGLKEAEVWLNGWSQGLSGRP